MLSDKTYALFAFQSLYPEQNDINEDDIEILTLENVCAIDYYNDFSMMVKNHALIFIEAQSTWTINILPKIMIYYVTQVKDLLIQKNWNLHSRKMIPLPEPAFFVVYTGNQTVPEEINLADYFFHSEKTYINVSAQVITKGNQEKNDFFFQYREFCRIMNDMQEGYEKDGMKAIEKVIELCIQNNIFKEYFEVHKGEVVEMLDVLFDQERITRLTQLELEEEKRIVKEKARAEGREEGLIEGRKKR